MHSTPLKRWLVGLTLLGVVLFSAFLWLKPLLYIGAGYAAKHACSCHFLQGRELAEIREHDLNFSVLGWTTLTAAENRVSSSFFGLAPRTAVRLEGGACVLINDAELPPPEYRSGRPESENAIPAGPTALSDSLAGWDEEALREAVAFGMQPVPGGGARGLVVYADGELLTEAYGSGFDRSSLLLGWSMTKSLTGMAVGAVLARSPDTRRASPEAITQLFPEIWKDRRSEISLADLLRMNSGLAWNEGYGSITDATVMLHERADFADFAARHQLAEEPGRVWNYSSGTTNLLMDYLAQQLGGDEALYAFLYDSLYHRIAPSLVIEPDQSGRPVGSSYGWATARDWANLGQFMLQDGVWRGDTLLPPGWVDFMREPATGSEGMYGAQLWLPGEDMPSLPSDAFMMRGFQDQRVFVIPSRGLVVARLGHGADKVTDFDGLIRRILAAHE